MQPESSDGFASVGTILPEGRAALLPGGSFRFSLAISWPSPLRRLHRLQAPSTACRRVPSTYPPTVVEPSWTPIHRMRFNSPAMCFRKAECCVATYWEITACEVLFRLTVDFFQEGMFSAKGYVTCTCTAFPGA